MKEFIKNKLLGRYFNEAKLKYNVDCKEGNYYIVFNTEIAASKVMQILEGALTKLRITEKQNLKNVKEWVADSRYNYKILKKINKYIDKIENRIKNRSGETNFKFSTRYIKYCNFKKNGSMVEIEILVKGDYVI